jgi:peptide/nickel transport system substrate-binding protein
MYSLLRQKLHHKKSSTALLVSFLLCAVLVLSGCSQAKPNAVESESKPVQGQAENKEAKPKKLTFIINFKSGSLDPNNSYTALKAGALETLVRMDEKLEIKPWLASKWEVKDDKTWLFTIRDGITFHDGTKLDAAAAKASLERGITASKPLAGVLKVASMEANGQQLTIVTKEPHPALPSELINPYAAIFSVEAEKKMGTEAFNAAPVGTGPFKIKKFTPNIEILLDRYDGYWDGKAKLNEVVFKFNEDGNVRALALQSKEADIVYQIPAETVQAIQKDNQLKVDSVASLRVHFLLYNQQKPLLQDVKVRTALDLLLNRESLAKDIMLGNASVANGPFHTSLPFGSKEPFQKQDIEGAKKLLDEAGFKVGADGKLAKDGKPLSLQAITYKGRPELPLMAQLLQSDAAKVGVTMEIKTVENVDTYLRENKDWDLVTYSNSTSPRGDGGFYLNTAFISGGSLNPTNLNSAKVNEAVAQLNAAADIQKRVQLTQDAVKAINQEVLHSFAIYPNIIVGVNKRVTDWVPGAEDYYYITNKMDVK